MLFDCWEPPIPAREYTPQRGNEQLIRMRACYARQHLIMVGMLTACTLLVFVLAAVWLVAAVMP